MKYFGKLTDTLKYKSDIDTLAFGKKQIMIKLQDERVLNLAVNLFDKVGTLKKKIEEEENIPASHQKLMFHYKDLVDKQLLPEYNIKNKSVLKLT